MSYLNKQKARSGALKMLCGATLLITCLSLLFFSDYGQNFYKHIKGYLLEENKYTRNVIFTVLQVDNCVGILILNGGSNTRIESDDEFIAYRKENDYKIFVNRIKIRKVYAEMSSAMILPRTCNPPIKIGDYAKPYINKK